MKINFHLFVYFICTLMTGLLLPLQAGAQGSQKIKLQLKWLHQFQFAGYYAAKEKGYYKEAGLDVELLEGSSQITPVNMVTEGHADFGITGSDIILSHVEKKSVVVTSVIFQHSPYVFITMKDSKIKAPSDLAGKKIMASDAQGWSILKSLFLIEGIPLKGVSLIKHSWTNMDLVNGKVDAISAYSTVEPQQFRNMGYEVTLIKPMDYGLDFYGDVIFTSRDLANRKPGLVEKFNNASIKGWQYAMSHPAEIASLILKLPGVKDRGITKESLMYEAKEMRSLILSDLVEIGHINPGRWQNILNIYKKLGLAEKNATIDGFIFKTPAAKKILYFDILLYTLGTGVLLFVLGVFGYWQLSKLVLKKTADLQNEILTRKSAEQRLELAIESAGLGIWDWNLVTRKFNYDPKWIKMLGYEIKDFPKSTNWIDLIHPEDHDLVEERMTALSEGRELSNNMAYRLKTGQNYWTWVLAFCKIVSFDDTGKASHVLGTHLDIDVIKGKEIKLQELTKQLRKSNIELEKFAYIASHNLRAPLVNLISLTEMQAEENAPDGMRKEIDQKINYCVHQLNETLNDLIEIVACKSDDQIKKEVLDLENELNLILKSIESQVNNSGGKIACDFSECQKIYFPKRALNSILINLLTNSLKYKSDDRQLLISLKTVNKRDHTILYFSDNGLGIDMEKFGKKIFGLYQRYHPKIEGKGLGLYIIKSQIEALDGKIEVDSIPDVGTTFRIYFKK